MEGSVWILWSLFGLWCVYFVVFLFGDVVEIIVCYLWFLT